MEVGKISAEIRADTSKFDSDLNSAKSKASSAASDIESRFKGVGSAIGGALKTGITVAAVAATGVATAGLSSYRDLEEASSQAASKAVDVYGKSAEEIGAEYDKLLKHVMDVSADVGASTVFDDLQVAKTFDALAAGGVDISNVGRTQLLPFMNLASSTGEDLTAVTDLLTGSMASFGYGMDDSGVIADQLAMAMNASKASMSTLNYALRQGGSTASATGMELSEFSAIVGVLADRNYTGEQSGAALKTALLSLYTPTKVQREAMEKLGITYDQVDPRVHNFRDTLKLLIDKGADIGDFGQIFTDSSGAVMYALAEEGDAVDDLKEKIVGSQGLSQTMSDLMMDSNRLVGAWEEAKGATMGMVTAIGGYLEPAAVKLLNAWKDLIPALREFGSAIASGDWSKVGQLLGNAWTVAKEKGLAFFDWAKTALQSIDWGTLATQAGGLIAGGIQTGLSALSGLGATVGGWIKDFDYAGAGRTISGWIKSGIDALVGIGTTIGGWIKDFDYAGAGTTIAGWLKTGFDTLSGIAATLAGWIKDFDYTGAGTTIAGWISTGIETLKDIGATIGGWIEDHGGWKGVGEAVGKKVSDGIKAITTYAQGIADRLKEWYNSSGQAIGQDIGNKIATGIKAVTTYADGIKTRLQDWINGGGAATLGYDIGNRIAEAIKSVADLGKWIADSLTEKGGGSLIRGAIETAVEWASLGASAVSQFVSGFVEGLAPIGASIYNTIIDAVSGVLGMLPYGVGEGLAGTLQSTKMEVDWGKKTYNAKTGTWSSSSSSSSGSGSSDIAADTGVARTSLGTLAAKWLNGQLMISQEIGSGKYITAEEWAKKAGASGKFTEEDIMTELKKLYGQGGVATTSSDREKIIGWFREGEKEAAAIEVAAARTNAATTTTTTKKSTDEIYKATNNYKTASDSVNAAMVYTNNWANTQFLTTSSVLSNDMKTGSSAILESAKAAKVNFDLGTYNWVTGTNQSKNIQTSAANQSAAIALNNTNERAVIEINAANASSLYTTAAGLGLKANVDTSGTDFSTKVEAAGDNLASAVGSIAAMLGGGSFGGGVGAGGKWSTAGGKWSTGTTNFTDCLFEGGFVDGCTGVSIPGLKYTNPQGVTSIINPMNYISGGGISNYINLRARGGLVESPEIAMIGEAGSELVLPHDITQEIVSLTKMGRAAKTGGGGGDTTININLDGRQIAQAVMNRATGMMRQAGLGIR